MSLHDLSGEGVVARMEEVARRSLSRYDLATEAQVSLLNLSENATFRVVAGDEVLVLRVHRLGYHSHDAILSELAWLDAVREDAGVRTPQVRPAVDGERVLTLPDPGGDERHCVMFELLPGREPAEDHLVESFEELGAITARMHRHARGWTRPPGFTRFEWDYNAAFGSEARWGRWQDGMGVGSAELEVLGRLDGTLRRRLDAYGKGAQRYGLIHADLRLTNLLVDDATGTSVIDFDDCGFSWLLYDLGAALTFMEHHPQVPEMMDSWFRGYRSVLELAQADEDEAWTFVLYRRLLLVAWIGSHTAVDAARELGAGYTRQSCDLAEQYLSRFS